MSTPLAFATSSSTPREISDLILWMPHFVAPSTVIESAPNPL